MALSYKARRRWSLVILLVGLPAYVVAAVTVVDWFDRPPFLVELTVYVVLGIVWALPFRFVFRGIGQADPDASGDDLRDDLRGGARAAALREKAREKGRRPAAKEPSENE